MNKIAALILACLIVACATPSSDERVASEWNAIEVASATCAGQTWQIASCYDAGSKWMTIANYYQISASALPVCEAWTCLPNPFGGGCVWQYRAKPRSAYDVSQDVQTGESTRMYCGTDASHQTKLWFRW